MCVCVCNVLFVYFKYAMCTCLHLVNVYSASLMCVSNALFGIVVDFATLFSHLCDNHALLCSFPQSVSFLSHPCAGFFLDRQPLPPGFMSTLLGNDEGFKQIYFSRMEVCVFLLKGTVIGKRKIWGTDREERRERGGKERCRRGGC